MGMKKWRDLPEAQGLYDPRHEHDACGIGFVANIRGERSYGIVDDALKILENLKHRGGEGADHKSGDGAGILTQIPHDFFHRECEVLGFSLPPEGEYGVGMIFAHRYEDFRKEQMRVFEEIVKEEGQTVLGWREVPIDESIIGEAARSIRPRFLQVFIGRNPSLRDQMILSASSTSSGGSRRRRSFRFRKAWGRISISPACPRARSCTRGC